MLRALLLPGALGAALASPGAAAEGDAARGKSLYESRCIACHSIDANRIGPMHRGVFGRPAGSVEGYDYSSALRRANLTWNETTLDAWLAEPENLVPGQKMGYSVPEARDRANLIAYLKTVSR